MTRVGSQRHSKKKKKKKSPLRNIISFSTSLQVTSTNRIVLGIFPHTRKYNSPPQLIYKTPFAHYFLDIF